MNGEMGTFDLTVQKCEDRKCDPGSGVQDLPDTVVPFPILQL